MMRLLQFRTAHAFLVMMITTTPSVEALSNIRLSSSTRSSMNSALRESGTGEGIQTSTSHIAKHGGWTNVAIQAARDFTSSQRKKLQNEGVLGISRPITILGKRHHAEDAAPYGNRKEDNRKSIHKIIHFQRHGQGYHNLICDILREERKGSIDFDSSDPMVNPMVRMEVLDPPLTYLGIVQSQARRLDSILSSTVDDDNDHPDSTQILATQAESCTRYKVSPQLVIVSPLLRCLQTAQYTFQDFYPHDPSSKVPWIAHEGCREELGLLVGNKRRCRSEIMLEYPEIDFSHVMYEDDVLWENHHERTENNDNGVTTLGRESLLQQSERIYSFLTEFVAQRPETEIAIISHSSYLFTMLNAVVTVEEEDLQSWFLTSEVRTMELEFVMEEQS